ncbi:MAG: NRDE family protein [Clostridia bacterium]
MCLVVLAWQALPDLPLAVAANRDEFHAREAAPAAFWDDAPAILAGRDLRAKGTWMGVARDGRFAAVTNYRGATEPSAPHSRGSLPVRFLSSNLPVEEFMRETQAQAKTYSGFNLLAADDRELWWLSNRDSAPRRLEPGFYGLGNFLLDSPDVEPVKRSFTAAAALSPAPEPFFAEVAKAKIVNPAYGTRCSTVLLRGKDVVRYAERSFAPDGGEQETRRYEFRPG